MRYHNDGSCINRVTIDLRDYMEISDKAAKFNALTQCIKDQIDAGKAYPVDDNLVLALTGMGSYKAQKEQANE